MKRLKVGDRVLAAIPSGCEEWVTVVEVRDSYGVVSYTVARDPEEGGSYHDVCHEHVIKVKPC